MDVEYKKQFLQLSKINVNSEFIIDINDEKKFEKIENFKSELKELLSSGFSEQEINKINEQHFEKDHDKNHQVDFLYISSNLIASNFNIVLCSRDKVKFISGNIVPSIPTTTSYIVGFISSQILQSTEINYLRQISIDLSTPFFLIVQHKTPFKNKDYLFLMDNILSLNNQKTSENSNINDCYNVPDTKE